MDTIAIAEQLEAAGTPPAQAKAHARILHQAIEARAATKTDLQTAVAEIRAEIKTEIAALRAELKAEIAELRSELKAEIAELRAEFDVLRKELQLQRWMLGTIGALMIAVLVKLFTL